MMKKLLLSVLLLSSAAFAQPVVQPPTSGGGATAAAQATGNASLSTIATNTTTLAGTVNTNAIRIITSSIAHDGTTTTYSVNDAYSDSPTAPTVGGFTFTNACNSSGGTGVLRRIMVEDSNVVAQIQGELWIFNDATTEQNDNVAWAGVGDSIALKLVGVFAFTTAADVNQSLVWVDNLYVPYQCVNSANLRYLVKVKNAYTPQASETLYFKIAVEPRS